jgi:hypothetical protein
MEPASPLISCRCGDDEERARREKDANPCMRMDAAVDRGDVGSRDFLQPPNLEARGLTAPRDRIRRSAGARADESYGDGGRV